MAGHNRELARLELRQANQILNQRSIASPIDGVVVERVLSPGEYVSEQSNIMTIAEIGLLNVEVFVPIALHGAITVGMEGRVRPEEPIGGEYAARVSVVDRVLDAASGTFGVRLELPNPGHALPAGLKCKVRFVPE